MHVFLAFVLLLQYIRFRHNSLIFEYFQFPSGIENMKIKHVLMVFLLLSTIVATIGAVSALVDAPPVDIPPVETPPVDAPPVETPPVDVPPDNVPPDDVPPVDTPPIVTPPVDTPSFEVPPVD
jgi:hypothetical protein